MEPIYFTNEELKLLIEMINQFPVFSVEKADILTKVQKVLDESGNLFLTREQFEALKVETEEIYQKKIKKITNNNLLNGKDFVELSKNEYTKDAELRKAITEVEKFVKDYGWKVEIVENESKIILGFIKDDKTNPVPPDKIKIK